MKRIPELFFALLAILFLIPLFLVVSFLIVIGSKGGVIYKQSRVGKNNRDFFIYKFRSMHINSEKSGLITTGSKDDRVTRIGHFLRKYKLDELPQLFNIFKGEMSIVGPRPEVRKYVDFYTDLQLHVLSVRPGLTDYASLVYMNEGELLGKHKDPEKFYVEEIMPEKLALNLKYLEDKNLKTDLQIIIKTMKQIISGSDTK